MPKASSAAIFILISVGLTSSYPESRGSNGTRISCLPVLVVYAKVMA